MPDNITVQSIFVLITVSFLFVGCSIAPSWVRDDAEKYYGRQAQAVYGVGSAAAGEFASKEMGWEKAALSARANLDEARREYFKELLTEFAHSHSYWFYLKAFDEEADRIARGAAERIDLPVEIVSRWEDTRRLRSRRGTLHVMAGQRLADRRAVLDAMSDSLQIHEARVLTTRTSTVLTGFSAYMEDKYDW